MYKYFFLIIYSFFLFLFTNRCRANFVIFRSIAISNNVGETRLTKFVKKAIVYYPQSNASISVFSYFFFTSQLRPTFFVLVEVNVQ